MPQFQPKTFTYFLQRMAERVVARSALTDLEEGGELFEMLGAVARELDDVSFQTIQLQRVWDLDTAYGEDLDARAQDFFGATLVRITAVKATATVVFSRSGTAGVATIPSGHSIKVPGGGPEFVTTAVGSIGAGNTDSAAVAVIAVIAGIAGNVEANTIKQMTGLAGVETVTNPTPGTGGLDLESDDAFRSRLRTYIRSLPRGTVDALKFAALSGTLPLLGRVSTADVVEDPLVRGVTRVYIDNGSGTIESTDTLAATETIVASASGGEIRLDTANKPIVIGTPFTLFKGAAALTEGVDYTLNRATGRITLTVPLVALQAVTLTGYTWYTGLIEEVQKIIDGDAADRTNYPGYRAAGTLVYVLAPTALIISIEANIVIEDGYDDAAVRTAVQNAVLRHVNGLGINGDLIFNELIHQVMAVPGVFDVNFVTPLTTVIVGDAEVIRVTASDVDIL
mgnify:CR=1 FL=1|jgi:uncharacterized phage protein gp47/JayE